MKNNSGFSLVELIVVIAIMAILAGVAVPTYSKYIAKANDAKVMAELDAVKTAALGAGVSEGETINVISVGADGTVTVNNGTVDISTFFDGNITGEGASTVVKIKTDLSKTSYAETGIEWKASTQKWDKPSN